MLQRFKTFLLVVFMLLATNVHSKDAPFYPVAQIPKELSANANAVYRLMDDQITITNASGFVLKRQCVVTILKEGGIHKSKVKVGYNEFMKVNNISASIYDANGNRIRKLKTEEIVDVPAYDGFSLYSDSRVKVADPKYFNYPFTVAYEYEMVFNTLLYLPGFDVFQGYDVAVEQANYSIQSPSAIGLRFKSYNRMPDCSTVQNDGRVVRTWQYRSFEARRQEPYALHPDDLYPRVNVVAEEFGISGFKGATRSWGTFGLFIAQLNNGKDLLPKTTVDAVRDLVKDCTSQEEKVKLIYAYSQKKNRYVNVSIGLGGLEPYDAQTVDRLSYGDCKALSNYVCALLKCVGIPAFYTLISAGNLPESLDPEFVSDYFNHIVVSVPTPTDTLWLECTNPYSTVNYMSDFTDGRHALMITPEGGKLVRTPSYYHGNNCSSFKSLVTLNEDGSGLVQQNGIYQGTRFSDVLAYTLMDEADRRKALIKSVSVPDATLTDYRFNVVKADVPKIEQQMKLEVRGLASFMNGMMLVSSNPVGDSRSIPPYARKRESPVLIRRNYAYTDSVQVRFPDGYTLASLPQGGTIQSPMGQYAYDYQLSDGSLLIRSQFQINQGVYEPGLFNDFREFLERIAAKEDEKLVLKRL